MQFVVLTGLSGAGKNTGLRALEDAGFFVTDNLAPQLWEAQYDLATAGDLRCVAVCSDARSHAFLADIDERWQALRTREGVRLVYLEASDDMLLKRYNLTRRSHPLAERSLLQDLAHERELLAPLRALADVVIDSSDLTAAELAARLRDVVQTRHAFDLRLMSFGFKHGPPRDADLVLDVRSLPNPYYDAALSPRSGLDPQVADYVFQGDGEDYYQQLLQFARQSAERTRATRRSYNIAIGCTGGRHRSVAVAERLAQDLQGLDARVVDHRDIHKGQG